MYDNLGALQNISLDQRMSAPYSIPVFLRQSSANFAAALSGVSPSLMNGKLRRCASADLSSPVMTIEISDGSVDCSWRTSITVGLPVADVFWVSD